MQRYCLLAILLVCAVQFDFGQARVFDGNRLAKRQVSAKAWINGKEVDMSRGGTYTDKDGNVVSVNTNGGGVSMVSSSSGGANVQMNGCSIVNDVVHDCDGSTRQLTGRDRQMLADYNRQVSDFFRGMFPQGFPFNQQGGGSGKQYPQFPNICRACASSNARH